MRSWLNKKQSRRGFLTTSTRVSGVAATLLVAGCGNTEFKNFAAPRTLEKSRLSRFRNKLAGKLILPGDTDYNTARRVASFNPHTDKRPAMIVRCVNTADISRSILLARENDLEIAVRSGGHDVLGQSTCQDGMVIDLASMNTIRIDGQRQRVQVGAGVRAGELEGALCGHSLVAALGCNPAVGVAGLTLGGALACHSFSDRSFILSWIKANTSSE